MWDKMSAFRDGSRQALWRLRLGPQIKRIQWLPARLLRDLGIRICDRNGSMGCDSQALRDHGQGTNKLPGVGM
jgi:hypothetical protein